MAKLMQAIVHMLLAGSLRNSTECKKKITFLSEIAQSLRYTGNILSILLENSIIGVPGSRQDLVVDVDPFSLATTM